MLENLKESEPIKMDDWKNMNVSKQRMWKALVQRLSYSGDSLTGDIFYDAMGSDILGDRYHLELETVSPARKLRAEQQCPKVEIKFLS